MSLKIHVSSRDFAEAWKLVAPMAAKRSPKPILQNVRMSVRDGIATLEATNLEAGVRAQFTCDIESPGDCLLPGEKISQFLGASKSESLTISSDGEKKIIIAGQKEKLQIAWTLPDEFPAFTHTSRAMVRMRSEAFRTAIRCTQFACDVESSRYNLGGILLDFESNELTGDVVATDGRRLAMVKLEFDSRGDGPWDASGTVVVPQASLSHWMRILESSEHCEVSLDKSKAMLTCGTVSAWSMLVEGRFPRWRDVIPAKNNLTSEFTVAAGDLASLCKLSMVASEEESRGGDFRFAGDSLEISKATDDASLAFESVVSVVGQGDALSRLDLKFVNDAVANLPPEAMVTVHLQTEGPNLIVNGNIRHVIMPLSRT